MTPYDRLTIFRNRHRVRELRIFRARVQAYFEQFEYDDGLPIDWEGARDARAEINRLLPRIVQVVRAADLGSSMRNPAGRAVEILETIFSARHSHGAHQEILDVIDMAIGVYEANRYGAMMRTVNPFHYVMSAFGFIAGLPRRAFIAIGFLSPRTTRVRPDDVAGLETALARLAATEELIETRFAELRQWQAQLFSENAHQLTDVAERMDFVERVLGQQPHVPRLEARAKKVVTPT